MHISLSKDNVVQGSHCELGLPGVRLKNIICEQLFKAEFKLFFFTGVSNYCEERKKNAFSNTNFYIKKSKNLVLQFFKLR